MGTPPPLSTSISGRPIKRARRWRILVGLLLLWGIAAYLVVPLLWKAWFHEHPEYDDSPRITTTGDGHPGDAINLALVGSDGDVVRAMTAAGWHPADPITFESSVRIAIDSVFRKPDPDAPVSDLFLFGRKQDLAYELPIGDSPRQRHHVRYWRTDQTKDGRPLWFGAATLDVRVGLSDTTGQITHHVGPDIDAERDLILQGIQKAGWMEKVVWIDDFHSQTEGHNGGGDVWRTDGRLGEGTLRNSPLVPPAQKPGGR